MLTDKQKESLRGLQHFDNEYPERASDWEATVPTYFDFSAKLDDQGIPLFRSEADPEDDQYGTTVTLEDHPGSILIYYQYFIDSWTSDINDVNLDEIPEGVHQYLKNIHEKIVENIFDTLSSLVFDAKENSRGDWRAICVLQGV